MITNRVDHVLKVGHSSARGLEGIKELVVSILINIHQAHNGKDLHGIVHNPIHVLLVRARICRITM
jgi:hypothetical protein